MPKKSKKVKDIKVNWTYPTEEIFKRIDELEAKLTIILEEIRKDHPIVYINPVYPLPTTSPDWTITCSSGAFPSSLDNTSTNSNSGDNPNV